MFWGFSEALDLYEEYNKHITKVDENSPLEINVLLFGSNDPRHIIKTLAKSYEHTAKVNFYVIEMCPALIARHMLLTSIAVEPPTLLTLLGKTHLFMDVYGNSLLRSSSTGYVSSKANHFIKCVTDSEFGTQMQPIFNLSQLKYAERDCLENIFNFWRDKRTNCFDINACWKQRVRQHLNQRYDSRMGAFDWDLQMKLKEYGAQQICSQEYKYWRETGIGFTFPEYRQTHSNKTLAVQVNGRNYLGDITIGPFCTFGLSCADNSLLKSHYGQNEFRSTDITERNLFQLFYEIQERRPFETSEFTAHKLGMTTLDLGKSFDYRPTETSDDELKQFDKELLCTKQITVTYLSMNDVQCLNEGHKFQNFFDFVFIKRDYFRLVKRKLKTVFAAKCLVLMETAQLSVQRKEEISEFLKQIRNLAHEMELQAISNFNINLPLSVAKFKKILQNK